MDPPTFRQLLATRIPLFLLTIAASLPAAASVTPPYREIVGNGVNNNTDVTAAGACGFTIVAGSFVPGVCRDRSGAPCPATGVCDLERVPAGRCSFGSNPSCLWPQGAGFCINDANRGCLGDPDCAVVGGTCDTSLLDPLCACDRLDPAHPNFETNPSSCGGDLGVCSDGDADAAFGGFGGAGNWDWDGGELCTATTGHSGGTNHTNCGGEAGLTITGPRWSLENPAMVPFVFRKAGTGANPGTPIREIKATIATTLQDPDAAGVRRTLGHGDSYWEDWSWTDGAITGSGVSAVIITGYCEIPREFETDQPIGSCQDPATPGDSGVLCQDDTDCTLPAECLDRDGSGSTPSYCHEQPMNIIGAIWTEDVPTDDFLPTGSATTNMDVDGDSEVDCPPHCGIDYDFHTLIEDTIIQVGVADSIAGAQIAFDAMTGGINDLGSANGLNPAGAGDSISVVPVFGGVFLGDTPPECEMKGKADLPFVGRCSGTTDACDPINDSIVGGGTCASIDPGTLGCFSCYGPFQAGVCTGDGTTPCTTTADHCGGLGTCDLTGVDVAPPAAAGGPPIRATGPNILGYPVGYSNYGLSALDLDQDLGGFPRIGGLTRPDVFASVIVPLYVIATSGTAGNQVWDPDGGGFNPDDDSLGGVTLPAGTAICGFPSHEGCGVGPRGALGAGGSFTSGQAFPIRPAETCCAEGLDLTFAATCSLGDICWDPEVAQSSLVSINTTPMRQSGFGPGTNRIPGCIGDSSESILFSVDDPGPCNDALGVPNTTPAADLNTGQDDIPTGYRHSTASTCVVGTCVATPAQQCSTDNQCTLVNGGVLDTCTLDLGADAIAGTADDCVPAVIGRARSMNPADPAPTFYTVAAGSGIDLTVFIPRNNDYAFKSDSVSCPINCVTGQAECVSPFDGTGPVWDPESCPVGDDFDGDGASNAADNCPTVANAGQTDADGDTVGDACDTCAGLPNPPFTGTVLANMTFVSGQRDDDGDGIGNRCDFKYGTAGSLIAPLDVSHMRSSVFSLLSLNTCGLSGAANCAQFDHDEAGALVAPQDVSLLRGRVFATNGPSCTGGGCTPPFGGPLGSGTEVFGKAECVGPAC